MDDVVCQCDGLSEEDIAFLKRVECDLSILADISRSDVLMYAPLSSDRAAVIAQARPHSISPVHAGSLLGRIVTSAEQPLVLRTLERERFSHGNLKLVTNESPIVQKVHPIRNA